MYYILSIYLFIFILFLYLFVYLYIYIYILHLFIYKYTYYICFIYLIYLSDIQSKPILNIFLKIPSSVSLQISQIYISINTK